MNARAKDEALAVIDREWRELDALFGSLSAEALEGPVFTGEGPGWRVRDLIPHVAVWQGRAAQAARKVVRYHLQPGPEDRVRTFLGLTGTVDDMNAVTFREWRERSVGDLLAEFRRVHTDLMSALQDLTPEQLMNGERVEDVYLCFRVPGLQHLRMHRAHLDAALTKKGATT